MQTDSFPISAVEFGGCGESGIYYFGEGLYLSGQCLIFYLSLINCMVVPKVAANDRCLCEAGRRTRFCPEEGTGFDVPLYRPADKTPACKNTKLWAGLLSNYGSIPNTSKGTGGLFRP